MAYHPCSPRLQELDFENEAGNIERCEALLNGGSSRVAGRVTLPQVPKVIVKLPEQTQVLRRRRRLCGVAGGFVDSAAPAPLFGAAHRGVAGAGPRSSIDRPGALTAWMRWLAEGCQNGTSKPPPSLEKRRPTCGVHHPRPGYTQTFSYT